MEKSQYEILREKLQNLRLEYKTNPNNELKDRVYFIDSKLKEIDKQTGYWHRPIGNYKSSLGYEIECAKYNLLDEIGHCFGIYKFNNWLSKHLNKIKT